ncbi:MAG: HlyD family efflux transporter periplasmic adaptor subunit, partial [Rhizobium sp.]|nr:HlyD family efflux transporter periplasmic adaptor subunit [Rhizobium sp.]
MIDESELNRQFKGGSLAAFDTIYYKSIYSKGGSIVKIEKEIQRMSILKNRKSKVIFIGVLAVLIIAAAIGMFFAQSKSASKNEVKQQITKVIKGDLSITVSGSGPIASSSKSDIYSSVSTNVRKIYFKDGDEVKTGDLIMDLEDFDANLKVKQLENSIAQAQLTQNSNLKYLKNNTVIAPISGEITDLQVKAGDNAAKNAILMTITDKSKLKFVVPFNDTYRSKLAKNQAVTVNTLDTTLDDTNTVTGHISQISQPLYKTTDGSEVYNVEIILDNTSALKEGLIANAEIDIAGVKAVSTNSGTLSYTNSMIVRSESGGIVEKVNVEAGQLVKKGTVLAEFQNDDLVINKETTALKIEDLYNQLDSAKKQSAYYKIYAPMGGVLNLQNIKESDAIKQSQLITTITDYGKMAFDISVDELDIAKIQVGQQVNITIDALAETSEKPLSGVVTEIAMEGTTSSGVTTYPVTIEIKDSKAVKSGMNADAEILVSTKSNTLYLPVEAVKKNGKSSVVTVKNAEGTTTKKVTTGINNEAFIEILSGLNEGDVVVLPQTSSSGTKTTTQQQTGMPMGGPPPDSGGGPGGN